MSRRALSAFHAICFLCVLAVGSWAAGEPQGSGAVAPGPSIRVATYNTSLFRNESGQLIRDLEGGENAQSKENCRGHPTRPPRRDAAERIRLRSRRPGGRDILHPVPERRTERLPAHRLPLSFHAPGQHGPAERSRLEQEWHNGRTLDAIGFGRHEGQYGMLVLSQYPIEEKAVRTFQKLLWRDMPEAKLPVDPQTGKPFYSDEDLGDASLVFQELLGRAHRRFSPRPASR